MANLFSGYEIMKKSISIFYYVFYMYYTMPVYTYVYIYYTQAKFMFKRI